MNPLIQQLIEIAKKEVGTREEGGNNCGAHIQEYQRATWLAVGPWAWCAAFCCWILREWLKIPGVAEALNIPAGKVDSWRCKTAGAFDWENWAKSKGITILPETAKAKAGDFVIFDFSHIGIVVQDQTDGFIYTVEGNTNGKGERDSTSGDGVWSKKRAQSLVKCYIRLLPSEA